MKGVSNPDLDMTLQKGFIFCSKDVSQREIICNWCARERYAKMYPHWAPINIDLNDDSAPKCDVCGKELGEGPAIFGDYETVQEEPMGEVKTPRGYSDDDLGICHQCLTDKPHYKKVVGNWQVIMPGNELVKPIMCMVCQKEI